MLCCFDAVVVGSMLDSRDFFSKNWIKLIIFLFISAKYLNLDVHASCDLSLHVYLEYYLYYKSMNSEHSHYKYGVDMFLLPLMNVV